MAGIENGQTKVLRRPYYHLALRQIDQSGSSTRTQPAHGGPWSLRHRLRHLPDLPEHARTRVRCPMTCRASHRLRYSLAASLGKSHTPLPGSWACDVTSPAATTTCYLTE